MYSSHLNTLLFCIHIILIKLRIQHISSSRKCPRHLQLLLFCFYTFLTRHPAKPTLQERASQHFISSCRWVIKNRRFVDRKPSITHSFTDSNFWGEKEQTPCLHQVAVPVTSVKNGYTKPNYSLTGIKRSFAIVVLSLPNFNSVMLQIRLPKTQDSFKQTQLPLQATLLLVSSFTMWKLGQHSSCLAAQHE